MYNRQGAVPDTDTLAAITVLPDVPVGQMICNCSLGNVSGLRRILVFLKKIMNAWRVGLLTKVSILAKTAVFATVNGCTKT